MDSIRCPRCAKELPDSAQFCRRCGYTIAWNIAAAPPPPPAAIPIRPANVNPRAAKRTAPPTPSKPRAFSVFAILFVVGGIIFFNRSLTVKRTPSFPTVSTPSFRSNPAYPSGTYNPYMTQSGSSATVRTPPFPPVPPRPAYPPVPETYRPWDPTNRTQHYNNPYQPGTYPNRSQNPDDDR